MQYLKTFIRSAKFESQTADFDRVSVDCYSLIKGSETTVEWFRFSRCSNASSTEKETELEMKSHFLFDCVIKKIESVESRKVIYAASIVGKFQKWPLCLTYFHPLNCNSRSQTS